MSNGNHETLVESAKAAINAVFGDRSVGRDQTRESLDDIAGDCQTMLDALDADEAAEARAAESAEGDEE